MKKVVSISVIITLFTLVLVLVYALKVLRDVDTLIPTLNSTLLGVQSTLVSVQAIETNTTRTEAELAGLLNATRHIAQNAREQEDQEFMMVQKLSIKAFMLVDDADAAVKNLGDVAPNLSDAIKLTTVNLNGALIGSQQMMKAATDDLESPEIKQSLDNIAETTKNTKVATQEAAATITTIHKGVDYELAQIMKPVKKVKVAVLFIANLAGKFFGY